MKKLFLVFSLLLIGLNVYSNELSSITLEGTDDGYNIVLKSDELPAVRKIVRGSDNIILEVKGVTTSSTVNAIYKSAADVSGIVIENVAKDEINVYISAKDIAKSVVLGKTPNGTNVLLNDRFPVEKVVWSALVLLMLFGLFKSAFAISEYENSLVIKKDIKDREIELYRNFQKELESMPSINYDVRNRYSTPTVPRLRRNYKELARR